MTWSGGGALGRKRHGGYRALVTKRREGGGAVAHWEAAEKISVLGEGSVRSERRRGSRRPEVEDDGGGDDAGVRRCAAWLVDVVDDGEPSGHGERARGRRWTWLRRAAATVTSRATSGRARERSQRGERVSARSGRERGFVPRRQLDEGSGEAAGSRVARMLCSPSSSCLPAWPSQAGRMSGGLAGPAGGPAGWRQVSLSLSLFPVLFSFSIFL